MEVKKIEVMLTYLKIRLESRLFTFPLVWSLGVSSQIVQVHINSMVV